MSKYKSFIHVLRLSRPECNGYLAGKVTVSVKMDGTNACLWYDEDDNAIHYGSRKREITIFDDNAGFAAYCESGVDEGIENLKQICRNNPNIIIFGEWLAGIAGRKFTGSIKLYQDGGFYVFAVYDFNLERYLEHDEWIPMLENDYDKLMRPIAVLDNPTEDEVNALLDKTDFNLPTGTLGEGIVLYNPTFRDNYGHWQVAKIVRSEYLAAKGTKTKKPQVDATDIEVDIAESYITDAEIAKEQNKILLELGEDAWVYDNKHIGRLVSTVWHEFITDSLPTVIKKYKNPTIDFARLNGLSNQRVRQFLKL